MTKEIPLTKGKVALVDDADYEWLMQWKWYAQERGSGLTYAGLPSGGPYMHRLIMNAPKGMQVDHCDLNGLNNQRNNLRLASQSQNLANRQKQKNNHSGFKGVVFDKKCRNWKAEIKINKACKHLGNFQSITDAARAYDAAALELYGEFARLNFPDQR